MSGFGKLLPAGEKRERYLNIFILMFGLLGAIVSFLVTQVAFEIDTDISHTAMLWQGVSEHGVEFFKDWLFTPDSWILSYVPLHFAYFGLFGLSPAWVIFTGWLVLFGSALAAGWLARAMGASRTVAIGLGVLILWVPAYVHSPGFISYPMSHGITNLFGLLAVACVFVWIKKGNPLHLLGCLLLLVAGSVSDPWMMAAFELPIFLAALAMSFVRDWRRQMVPVVAASAASLILSYTQVMGLFSFVPRHHFRIGTSDVIISNARQWLDSLAGLWAFIPGLSHHKVWVSILYVLLPGVLVLCVLLPVLRSGMKNRDARAVFFGLFSLLTAGGISVAFVIGDTVASAVSARFLLNLYVVSLIWLSLAASKHRLPPFEQVGKWVQRPVMALAAMYLVSSLLSLYPLVRKADGEVNSTRAAELSRYLRENGLEYGYGPYWGTLSNAVTWVSGGAVVVRPVVFDKNTGAMIVGNRPESARRWYQDGDARPDQDDFFVYLVNDGEECPKVDLCEGGVVKQFGKPSKVLTYRGARILVWSYPLLEYQGEPISYRLGDVVHFTAPTLVPWKGWSQPEAWGTWTDGEAATVRLKVDSAETMGAGLNLNLRLRPFLAEKLDQQNVEIFLNSIPISKMKLIQPIDQDVVIPLPESAVEKGKGELNLLFRIAVPTSPKDLGVSEDGRKLGIGVSRLSVTR